MQRKTQSRGLPTLSTDAGPFGPHRKPAGINAYILVAVSVAMLLAGGLVGLHLRPLLGYNAPRDLREVATSTQPAVPEHKTSIGTLVTARQESARDLQQRKRERDDVALAAKTAEAEHQAAQVDFSWKQSLRTRSICEDTCPRSRDGFCDDGRAVPTEAGDQIPVRCDLGTDCSDCGPYEAVEAVRKPPGSQGPISRLLGRNITVLTRLTNTKPAFMMTYTDPTQDVDVSGQMSVNRNVETGLSQIWWTVLRNGGCLRPDDSRGLVLDVGANFGYYALYAAAHGCRVIAWEPVPQFRAFLEYGTALNNFSALITIRPHAVSDKAGERVQLLVPQRGIWGTASIGGANIDPAIDNQGAYDKVTVVAERVDALVQEDVLLLKIDVEGFEPTAFQSCKGILDGHTIGNVFMEYSPGVYDKAGRWADYPDWPHMLTYLLEHGFTILHVADELARAPILGPGWDKPQLPVMKEVTGENLKHDLDDAKKLQARTLGCGVPDPLKIKYGFWNACNAIPEDLHPKSFRGCFGHNTNVWASIDRSQLTVGSPVGIMPLAYDTRKWWSYEGVFGIGMRPCSILDDIVRVRHRCRCLNTTACGDEAAMVEAYARQGLMPPDVHAEHGEDQSQ